jgi:Holliday junction resolvase RusA-like endonuclease
VARFTIPGRLPSLNESFKVGRFRFTSSRKRQWQKRWVGDWIIAAAVPIFTRPVVVRVRWVEKDRRRDYDNIAAGVKVILDALVKTGRIPNDGRKWVAPVVHEFEIDKKNPRVEVEINEQDDVAGPALPRSAQDGAAPSQVAAHPGM